jgi:hypothetical protein
MLPTYNWRFSLEQPKPSEKLEYSDDFIDVVFTIGETQIGFDIQNKTDSGIKINWDELSMIYPTGTSSRVIHSGIRLMDRNAPQAPTIIPPNAKVSDILIPSENIYYLSGQYGGWNYHPLFGGDNSLAWNDKEFSIYFPLEIKGSKKEYNFKFKINVSQPTPASGQKK